MAEPGDGGQVLGPFVREQRRLAGLSLRKLSELSEIHIKKFSEELALNFHSNLIAIFFFCFFNTLFKTVMTVNIMNICC